MRKIYAQLCTQTETHLTYDMADCADSRMCAIKLATSEGLLLLVNVYLPTDGSDIESHEEYMLTFVRKLLPCL